MTFELRCAVFGQVSGLDPFEGSDVVVQLVEEAARVQELVGDTDGQVGVVRVVVVGNAPHDLNVVGQVLGGGLHPVG